MTKMKPGSLIDQETSELTPEDRAAVAKLAVKWGRRAAPTAPDTCEEMAAARLRESTRNAWRGGWRAPDRAQTITDLAAKLDDEIQRAAVAHWHVPFDLGRESLGLEARNERADLNADLLARVDGLERALRKAQTDLGEIAAGRAGTIADELMHDLESAHRALEHHGFKRSRVAPAIPEIMQLLRDTSAERDAAKIRVNDLHHELTFTREQAQQYQDESLALNKKLTHAGITIEQYREAQDSLQQRLSVTVAAKLTAETALAVHCPPKRWWQFWRRS